MSMWSETTTTRKNRSMVRVGPSSFVHGSRRGDARPKGGILKASHSSIAASTMIGRRVQIPQRYTEVEDDGDGFCFGGQVISIQRNLALVKFDYTGDLEHYSIPLVRTWLLSEIPDELLDALSSL